MNEKVFIDDGKPLLLSHECRIDKRRAIAISPLPSINLTLKNGSNANEVRGVIINQTQPQKPINFNSQNQ